MLSDFSSRLCELRREKGVSQKEAAADLGISQALLSHYEKGIRECKLSLLCRISEYYGVSCDYLLGMSNNRDGSVSNIDMSEQWPDDDKLNISTLLHSEMILRELINKNDKLHGDKYLWCLTLFEYRSMIMAAQEGFMPKSWLGDENVCEDKFFVSYLESVLTAYWQSDSPSKESKNTDEIPVCFKTVYEKANEHIRNLLNSKSGM